MSGHHCHANDCPTPTPQSLLMCAKHWRMVPREMQSRVRATFSVRSSAPGADPASWADYYEAAADAVEHVARLEGKPLDNSYRRMVPKWREFATKREAS
jgi:hypothetical protein